MYDSKIDNRTGTLSKAEQEPEGKFYLTAFYRAQNTLLCWQMLKLLFLTALPFNVGHCRGFSQL